MPAWSGLWNGVHTDGHTLTGVANPQRRIRRSVRGMVAKKFQEILRTFVTDDVGSPAVASHTRVAADTPFAVGLGGGVRAIETVSDINRNLTAADETALLLEVDNDHTPTFPVEKSGNSGGGKLGF